MSVEYYGWAREQLDSSHEASVYDWSNMTIAEMAKRALAICELAKDGTTNSPLAAFACLEKMAQSMKNTYPYRR